MEMIERIARAIFRSQETPTRPLSPEEWAEERAYEEENWRNYTRDARAVLTAIREPSDAVLEAGGCSRTSWQRIIDEMLQG